MKKLFALFMLAFATSVFADSLPANTQKTDILKSVLVTGAGSSYIFPKEKPHRYAQAFLGGGSPTSATVKVQCSDNETNWTDAATITLSTAAPTDGAALQTVCPFMRGNVTAIAGTTPSVTLSISQ